MAKGTATGEFVVVSQVRTGCKRELQFVLKSQSEICGGESLGRTRASKNLNGDSRSTDAKKPISRSGLKPVIKKMRLTKAEEDENVVMSDTVGSALDEDEGKSDVVDIDEAKGLFSDSALVESEIKDEEQEEKIENGKCVEIDNGYDNVAMNEDHSMEQPEDSSPKVKEAEKDSSIAIGGDNVIIGREIVVACPADFSELAKLASRSCHVKLERGLGNDKPCRRLTRSMLKPEDNKFEADGDHINPERDAKYSEDKCVDASSSVAYGREEELHEQNSADPCVGHPSGSAQMSGHTRCVDKKEVNDTVDKPLRRFTRSLVKQESDSDNPILENNTEPADLGKVDVHANDVEIDDVQSPSVTTHLKRGRPKKFLRNFPAKLKEIFDSRILEGLTVYYLRGAKVYDDFFNHSCKSRIYIADVYVTIFS